MYILYNLILFIALIIYSPILLYKKITKSNKKNINEQFGFYSKDLKELAANNKTIWIHAVSVGETVAASPIVKELKNNLPDYKIIFSTTTYTGQNMAHKIINADSIIYFPFDLPFTVKRALNKIKPNLIMIIETELWPNFIRIADKNNYKIIYANGRISDKSFKKYKYLGSIMPKMLNSIDLIAMQSEQDKERVINLGAKKSKVFNLGNTKFDKDYSSSNNEQKKYYKKLFNISQDNQVFVAGSTHDDEEKNLIRIYKELKNEFQNLFFILAPRDIERAEEIIDIFNSNHIKAVKKTELENSNKQNNFDVILLNTIGELAQIYSISDLVFVGGSMMGKGGHNILEPAAQGKLVFFGPDMSNFKDSTKLLLENEVGIQIETYDELKNNLKYYLQNPKDLKNISSKAKQVILDNKGASKRIAKKTAELLEIN